MDDSLSSSSSSPEVTVEYPVYRDVQAVEYSVVRNVEADRGLKSEPNSEREDRSLAGDSTGSSWPGE